MRLIVVEVPVENWIYEVQEDNDDMYGSEYIRCEF